MRVQLETGGIDQIRAETVIVPTLRRGETPVDLPQGLAALDRRLSGRLADALASGDFKANAGDRLVVYGPRNGSRNGALVRCVLLGLGEAESLDDQGLRELGGHVGREFKRSSTDRIALVVPAASELAADRSACLIAEGAVLGAYRFDRYLSRSAKDAGKAGKKKTPEAGRLDVVYVRPPRSLATLRRRIAEAVEIAGCQVVARDLSNEPPNVLFPDSLAREARRIAREVGLSCRVLDVAEMTRQGMGAILAVGQGSAHPPRLIVLEHRPRTSARARRGKPETLALVGKGITFDSGGLSLKTATGMPDMKHDMSGAAAVIGAMRAIALLELPIRVVGIVAAAENMPSSTAYRPSDIIKSASGQTIEIVNTDAEGRLVLADALHHAVSRYAPSAMIDIATLTGAAMMAFGPWATAGLGNDEGLLGEVRAAADATGETVWPMPLYDAHEKAMRSKVADWKNSAGRDAGISTAGAFLRGFVAKTPWVHLDIAGSGMTSTQSPIHVGGGTGVGVRMLTQWVRTRSSA
jgi:leucyl aminopeptidase